MVGVGRNFNFNPYKVRNPKKSPLSPRKAAWLVVDTNRPKPDSASVRSRHSIASGISEVINWVARQIFQSKGAVCS